MKYLNAENKIKTIKIIFIYDVMLKYKKLAKLNQLSFKC
jgi:hypothetical protein